MRRQIFWGRFQFRETERGYIVMFQRSRIKLKNRRLLFNKKTSDNFSLYRIFRFAWNLMSRKTRLRLTLLGVSQSFVNLLDLVGISLVAILTGLSIAELRGIPYPKSAVTLFQFLGLEEALFVTQMSILAGATLLFFAMKTFLSVLISKSQLNLLAGETTSLGLRTLQFIFQSGYVTFITKRHQDLLQATSGAANAIILNFIGNISQLITDIFMAIVLIFGLFVFDQTLGWMFILYFGLIFLVLARFTANPVRRAGRDGVNRSNSANQLTLNSFDLFRELTLAGKLEETEERITALRQDQLMINARMQFIPILTKYILELAVIFGIFIVAASQVIFNDSTKGITALILFITATSRGVPALLRAHLAFLGAKTAAGVAHNALEFFPELQTFQNPKSFDLKNRDSNKDLGQHTNTFQANVVLENVKFQYPKSSSLAIDNVSLKIKSGEFVAIVGASGSGKSTLINLILGFLKPDSGKVMISGFEPALTLRLSPRKIMLVPQEVSLLDASLLANITLDLSQESLDAEVVQAISSAGLNEFVANLPEGVLTRIGGKGVRLSGGQKQKVALARIFFQNPSLIVLDEATSSLDNVSESLITNEIIAKFKNATRIVIAHRLSTVKGADLLVYMESGKIVKVGTFDEVRRKVPGFQKQVELGNL
jgi:ATP-binding cassette, subfamily B, bacterial PglK